MKFNERVDRIETLYNTQRGRQMTKSQFLEYLKEVGLHARSEEIVTKVLKLKFMKPKTLKGSNEEIKEYYCQYCGRPTASSKFVCKGCYSRTSGRKKVSTKPIRSKAYRKPSSIASPVKRPRKAKNSKSTSKSKRTVTRGDKKYTMSYGPRGTSEVNGTIEIIATNNKDARRLARDKILKEFGENISFKEITKKETI